MLAEAASNIDRHGSVLHVLETTIIGWIKQIKVIERQKSILNTNKVPAIMLFIVQYPVCKYNAQTAFPSNHDIKVFSKISKLNHLPL